jgi:hypothetical protein
LASNLFAAAPVPAFTTGATKEELEIENTSRYDRYTQRINIKRGQRAKVIPQAPSEKSFASSSAVGVRQFKQNMQRKIRPSDFRGKSVSNTQVYQARMCIICSANVRTQVESKHEQKRSRRTIVKEITIPDEGMTVRELASKMSLKIAEVMVMLTELGEAPASEDAILEVCSNGRFRKFIPLPVS